MHPSMAVEARYRCNRFPSQPQLILNSGDFMASKLGGANMYGTATAGTEYGGALPPSTSSNMPQDEPALLFYRSAAGDKIPPPVKPVIRSRLNSMLGAARKRARDSVDDPLTIPCKTGMLSAEHGIALDIHRQQLELDWLITQHNKRMRLEIEEKVRQQTGELLAVIRQGILRKLTEKDEEMHKFKKLNLVLQERVENLCVDNRLLWDLAQTSEAAVSSLRSNLQQVLAGAKAAEDPQEDAESCCGSSGGGRERAQEDRPPAAVVEAGRGARSACRGCGKREPCVLLLPCRHLCLCTGCGSTHHYCPVCGSITTGSVHVNMS